MNIEKIPTNNLDKYKEKYDVLEALIESFKKEESLDFEDMQNANNLANELGLNFWKELNPQTIIHMNDGNNITVSEYIKQHVKGYDKYVPAYTETEEYQIEKRLRQRSVAIENNQNKLENDMNTNCFTNIEVLDKNSTNEIKNKSNRQAFEKSLKTKFSEYIIVKKYKYDIDEMLHLIDKVWTGHLGIDVLPTEYGIRETYGVIANNAIYNGDRIRYGMPFKINNEFAIQDDLKDFINEDMNTKGIKSNYKYEDQNLIVGIEADEKDKKKLADIQKLREDLFMGNISYEGQDKDLTNIIYHCKSRSDLETLIKNDARLKEIKSSTGKIYQRIEILAIMDAIWKGELSIDTLTNKYGLRDKYQNIINSFDIKEGVDNNILSALGKEIKLYGSRPKLYDINSVYNTIDLSKNIKVIENDIRNESLNEIKKQNEKIYSSKGIIERARNFYHSIFRKG